MEINIIEINKNIIAELSSDKIEIAKIQDALDLMANCSCKNSRKIIIREENIIPDFFDLKTGVAGEILQKFSNYKVQLAIIGDFSKYTSKALGDFIYESNKYGQINFVSSSEEAYEKLAK